MGDLGSTPGLGRSPGEGKGYPLQYSALKNFMNGIVHEVAESDKTEQLSPSFLSEEIPLLKKRIASLCSIQDTGCLGLVHGDDPER